MKIEIQKNHGEIKLGDVLVGDNGKYYLVTKTSHEDCFPIRLIDLSTSRDVNGFNSLDSIFTITVDVGITRVIRSSNLILKEIEEG
ncbi:hypothetical protein AAXB25_14340 [Paenibacillus lautus]|uniref:hypothetical protein n=1 Tax=Paenibacillus lautus TaxID=1401 RepID=UPI003D279540